MTDNNMIGEKSRLHIVLFLVPRGFSPGSPVFPSPHKPTFLNSISRNQVDEETLSGYATVPAKLFFFYSYTVLRQNSWVNALEKTVPVHEKTSVS